MENLFDQSDQKLPEGTKVLFKFGEIEKEGIIVGISAEPIPFAGRGYIVDFGESFSEEYPYKCATCWSIFLYPIVK